MSNPLNNLENQGENYVNISGSVPALDLLARYATVQYKSDTTNFTLNNLNNSIDNVLDSHFFGNVDASLNTLRDIANLLESSHVFNKSLFYNENRQVAVGDISHNASVILDISGTDAITLPIGTTLQRPSSSNLATGQIRYNTTLNVFEGYNGNNWEVLNKNSINDLSDVSFNSLALSNNNALLWNSTNNRWESGTISVSGTQTNIDETTDISVNKLDVYGELKVDTINEKTNSSGVTIDGVLLKDGDISGNDASFNNIKLGNNDLQTMINDLQTSKQNILTAGNNITIIGNTISSLGGLVDLSKSLINDLSDVSIDNIQTDQYIKWNGEKFVPTTLSSGQTTLKQGQILDSIVGYPGQSNISSATGVYNLADNSTLSFSSSFYTIPTTYTALPVSYIQYKAPIGTKIIMIEIVNNFSYKDVDAMFYAKLYINGTAIDDSELRIRAGRYNIHFYPMFFIITESIINSLSGNPSITDTNTYQVYVKSFSTNHEVKIPEPGSTQDDSKALFKLTSFGESQGVDVNLGSISLNDLSDVSFNSLALSNNNALLWNSTNNRWEPGTISVSGGSSGGTSTNINENTDVSLNNLKVHGDLCGNDVSFNQLEFNSVVMNGHILPSQNAQYDLGNAEYKIRHLFLSDNSLWIGDSHKISIRNGQMKLRKRKHNQAPKSFRDHNDYTEARALEIAGNPASIANLTLNHWKTYAKELNIPNINTANDLFDADEDFDDENTDALDLKANINSPSFTGNVGIGIDNPLHTLHLKDISKVDLKFEVDGNDSHYIRKDGHYLRFRGNDDSTVLFELRNNADNGNNACSFPNGNLGVGVVVPKEKLDINGNSQIRGHLFMRQLPPTDSSSTQRIIYFDRVDENGYANIPDRTPMGEIVFRINENFDYQIGSIPIFEEYSMIRGETSSKGELLGGKIQGSLSFWTRPSESGSLETRMIINHLGDIGIGTSIPDAKLDVLGDISCSDIKVSGTATLDGKLDVVGDVSCSSLKVGGVSITQNGGISSVNNKGQTFFDLLTQQPAQFTKNGDPIETAASIDINWHYDDILANQTANILAKLSFQSLEKNKSLPFINEIRIDISGNVDSPLSGSNTWINLHTFSLSNTDDYNVSNFKTYKINKTSSENANDTNILNILSKLEFFDLRIYGVNYAENHPTVENRALLFENIQFQEPLVPPAPRFQSENNISSNDTLVINYDVSATEIGRPNSLANIISAITEYSENETNSSSIYSLDTTTLTDTESKSNIGKNTNFTLTLNSLRAGTKYNYKVKAKNNIKDEFSAFSDQRVSNMLRLPDDNSVSTTVVLTKTNNVYVTTPTTTANLSNDFVTYINTAVSTYKYEPTIESNQTIQITKPYSSTQQSTSIGYGKWVDNSENLVNLKCSIDGTLKQTITFNGFNTASSNNGTATRTNQNSNTFNYFDSLSQTDIYTDDSRKGFRLKGTFSLNQITNTNAVSAIGTAQSTPHTIKYEYNRHSDVGGTSSSDTHNVYIDTLSTNPSAETQTNTATVKSVIWTMGIPSVKTMDIDFVRKYININSNNMYIPGNRIIAKIKDIGKVNKSSDKNITLARNTASGTNNKIINDSGTYEYTSAQMETATSSYYHGAYYDEAVGIGAENGTNLTVQETIYSLKAYVNSNSTLFVDHYFDKNNYNSTGGSNISRKLSYTDIYEITNSTELAKFSSNIGGIGTTQYTTTNTDSGHQKIPKDWTLLFISGKFRTNTPVIYPNVNNYEWNSIVTTGSQYSAGTSAYAKDGTIDGAGNKFKWIVFKFNGTSDITTFSTNEGDVNYLNVYQKLSNKGFTSTVLQQIKPNTYVNPTASEMGDKDVICFIKQEDSNSTDRVGNLLYLFQSDSKWYDQDANISLSTMLSSTENPAYSSFGCLVERSNTDWGAQVLNNTGNDIYLFLGLNNSENLY